MATTEWACTHPPSQPISNTNNIQNPILTLPSAAHNKCNQFAARDSQTFGFWPLLRRLLMCRLLESGVAITLLQVIVVMGSSPLDHAALLTAASRLLPAKTSFAHTGCCFPVSLPPRGTPNGSGHALANENTLTIKNIGLAALSAV